MIIKTIHNVSSFINAFRDTGREHHFSFEGFDAIYNFLEDSYSDSSYELDVIALCCSFTEYNEGELTRQYGNDNESLENLLNRLNNLTIVIITKNFSYVIQEFSSGP